MTSISSASSAALYTQQQTAATNRQQPAVTPERPQVENPIVGIPENERPQLSPEQQRELIDRVEARQNEIAQREQNVQDAKRQAATSVADYNQTQRVIDAYVTSATNGESSRDSNTISPDDIQVTEQQYRIASGNQTPTSLYNATQQGSEANPTLGQIIDNQI
ncbi:hypothetical protein IC617_00855 [Neiella sp. HB171785]|uniref:Uncharacterized protein n=1 Tax=Neiella litorisoli TaxID=2771431 RepID=A0A8J6QSP6_9GAMM|nr:hypothetical protein [Neiella litorisoli]MBD1387967.1 hypothetical protein [Neiella litorisoli]